MGAILTFQNLATGRQYRSRKQWAVTEMLFWRTRWTVLIYRG